MKSYQTGRQAIETRYLGPTEYQGSRIVASCFAKRRIYDWDYSLDSAENHLKAANALFEELGWDKMGKPSHLVGGQLCGGNYAFVLVKS